jgi:hypothetical protein
MSTLWIYSIHVFVPASSLTSADSFGAQIDPDSGGAQSFCIPLSADGTGTPTYFCCCLPATEAMRVKMHDVLIANSLPGMQFFRTLALSDTLELTNNAAAQPQIGSAWTFANSLSAVGLQVILPPGTI